MTTTNVMMNNSAWYIIVWLFFTVWWYLGRDSVHFCFEGYILLFCLPSIDCSVRLHVYLNIYWLRHWKIMAATALVKYNTDTTSTGRCVVSGGRTDLERDKQSANVGLLCTQMLWSKKGQIGKHLMVKEMKVCVVSSKMGHLISDES